MADNHSTRESQLEGNPIHRHHGDVHSRNGHHRHRHHRGYWQERKGRIKKWMVYILVGIGILAILLFSVIGGLKLDALLNASPLFSRAIPILALIVIFSFFYKRFYK